MDLTKYNINVNELPESQSFEPIPEGKYTAIVQEVDLKETNDGTGRYFKVKLAIHEGQYKGRFVWTNINWINKNKQAEDIGKQQLRIICDAAGISGYLKNTDELCNAIVKINVEIRQEEGYDPQNIVKRITPMKDSGPRPQPGFKPSQSAPSPQPQPTKAPMPWGVK